jgi:hypothetical protein
LNLIKPRFEESIFGFFYFFLGRAASARLATRPEPIGSETFTNTIGIVRLFRPNAAATGVVCDKAFASTRRVARGIPIRAGPINRQAAVELFAWLRERLQAAFDLHGTVPQDDLDRLDWPAVP